LGFFIEVVKRNLIGLGAMAAATPVIKFEAGSWCWIPHDEHMFLPAKVNKTTFKRGDAGEVTLEDGKVGPSASV